MEGRVEQLAVAEVETIQNSGGWGTMRLMKPLTAIMTPTL
jgi:hypothetical protein